MTRVDRLWVALGKAVAANASTKQVDGIARPAPPGSRGEVAR